MHSLGPMASKTLRPQNLKLALRAASGLGVGSIYALPLERNVLGRNVEATVPVDDAKVSRSHASIDIQNGFHYLFDMGSINGTFLNGRRIEHATLISVGDEIRLGSTVLKVELLDQAKEHLGRNWKEPTRAIMRPADLVGEQPVRVMAEVTGSRWQSLLPGGRSFAAGKSGGKSRWLMLGFCCVLIAAALATSMGRFSV